MKWKNKGREYEKLGCEQRKLKKIFLYGKTELRDKILKIIEFLKIDDIEIFTVDSNEKKRNEKNTISVFDFLQKSENESFIVVDCTKGKGVQSILLESEYFRYNKNLFSYIDFINKYLPNLIWYRYKKRLCSSIAIHFSTKCNLRCEHCGVFTCENNNQKDRTIEEIKKDIDLVFQKFDYVLLIGTAGGEPFMYNKLDEIITHMTKYADKIFCFGNTTNCTIEPNCDVVNALVEFNKKSPYVNMGGGARITLDDYSDNVKNSRPEKVINQFKGTNIKLVLQKYNNWIDFKVGKENHSSGTEEMLTVYHDVCQNTCWWMVDGKFFTCGFIVSQHNIGKLEIEENDYVDLRKCTPQEFIEFQTGYTEKGYFELCKKCGGYLTINRNIIEAAKQRKSDY